MYYTFVLESKEGSRCVGVTRDINSELKAYNNKSRIWTRKGTNWKVIYLEESSDLSSASRREEWLKTDAGKYYINNLPEQAAA